MGDREEQPVCAAQPVQPLLDALDGPSADLGVRLAAAAAGILAGLPAGVLLGVRRPSLGPRQPLPRAEIDLAEPLVDRDVEAALGTDRGRRCRGRACRSRGDERVGLHRLNRDRAAAAWARPISVERRVELALEATAGIPLGTAVAQQDDRAAHEAGGSASAGSGNVGQSFHSRSSA